MFGGQRCDQRRFQVVDPGLKQADSGCPIRDRDVFVFHPGALRHLPRFPQPSSQD
jgi:hypothetical protein